MPISNKKIEIDKHAKSDDKSYPLSNYWVTNGGLGSKDAVLVFRTCLLTTNPSTLQPSFDYPESECPSASSTCIDLSAQAQNEKSFADSLPKSFNESKSKKRHLELSSDSSASSSSTSLENQNVECPTIVTETTDPETKENEAPKVDDSELPAEICKISYKFVNAETRLLRKILDVHGWQEAAQNDQYFNLLWTGNSIKPDMLRNLKFFQRVNHFPRSSELTRKDRLYKNIQEMQHNHGYKHFDIVPQTFILPADFKQLVTAHNKSKGPWIVKPVASSRGRGIFLAKTPDEIQANISSDEQVVVARYIANPLCVNDGHKCDIRIYVAVTSFDPLIIYVYEEGLVRIATVKYDNNAEHLWNPCMHLCNYSINKYHTDYVKSNSPGDENVGHKWSLSALLRHLKNEGCNTEQLMLNIEEIIIKAIFACAEPIVSACRMFVNHVTNCFELFGFDILIDENLKPWLLEVNLSPSLGCDSPLDTKVKANLLTDLLTLVGIPAQSPRPQQKDRSSKIRSFSAAHRVHSADHIQSMQGKRSNSSSLTVEEARIVKAAKGQFERRGGFVRIFPAPDSMQKYGTFLDPITGIPTAVTNANGTNTFLMIIPHNYNQMLFAQLFGNENYKENDVDERIMKYERALDRSLTIVMSPKPLVTVSSHDDIKKLLHQIRKSIENGNELSVLQARRAFSNYLEHVLKRLLRDPKQSHEEYVIKFLQRISNYLRQPFLIRNVDHSKISSKERGAMVAKLLGDYLHMYNKESEAYVEEFDRVGIVSIKLFNEFLRSAQELDIEMILTLHTNLTKQMPFLYTSCSSGAPAIPLIPVGAHGFLKSLPFMAPGGPLLKEMWRLEMSKSDKAAPIKVHAKDKTNHPIKKKVPVSGSGSARGSRDRERSAWLFQ